MATNQTYHVRAEKDGYMPAETNSIPIMRQGLRTAPLGERLVLALALVPIGGGILASEDKAKYTGHEPVEFVLQPIGNTNFIEVDSKH